MILNIIILVASLFFVIEGATLATKYSTNLASDFKLSKYIIAFILVAFISILPETLVSINSAIKGIPEFGLGTLFGSNVADLTLVFAILIIFFGREMKIESRIIKNIYLYPVFLVLPLILGADGYYSRWEGIALLLIGLSFYYLIFRRNKRSQENVIEKTYKVKDFLMLIFSLILLLLGSHFTVIASSEVASFLEISPILIAMLFVSLGTTMPELFYSIKSVQGGNNSLAVGDILGTVLADATIVVGILSLIQPFSFPVKIIYLTGAFMALASIVLLYFMISGKKITRSEGYILLVFWLVYVVTEFILGR
jgi:cation:H+ antiporter